MYPSPNSRRLLFCLCLGLMQGAGAQQFPGFGNPSPTAGSSTSEKANATADKAAYQAIEYPNRNIRGPQLVVIPGEIKSSNLDFTQRFLPNNIADFAEIELSRANFGILERSNLGPVLQEFELAYNLGDPETAGKYLKMGKLKSTRWIMKFDILKAEQVAEAKKSFDGGAIGGIAGALIGGIGGAVTDTAVGSVQTAEATGVWLIGMRYKIIDATTTEQVAQGYNEQKMEVGAQGSSVLGVGSEESGGLTLDGMVQRLVQQSVWEIDRDYKRQAAAPAAAAAPAPAP
jgi:hypothetical protein